MQQRAHDEYERHKQAAIRINELAERIHTEADANALVSEIASIFANELPGAWLAGGVNQRVAKAEYQSVREPGARIQEQRIVDVWNQYAREIGAPEETLVTVSEIHNLRDAERTIAQRLWARGSRTIWAMPNIYAVAADGEIAAQCRAVEAIRVIYDLEGFQNLRAARDRVRTGIVVSKQLQHRSADSTNQPPRSVFIAAHVEENPVHAAERRYVQERGLITYNLLLKRLFDELFPAD